MKVDIIERKIVNNPTTLKINGDELRVVQDNEEILKCLKNGESVVHWEGGYSLHPIIQNMEYCKISPIKPRRRKIRYVRVLSFGE